MTPRPLARLALLLCALAAAPTSAAEGPRPSDQALTLATCHGRYMATVEHSRLVATENDAAKLRLGWLEAMMNAIAQEFLDHRSYGIELMRNRVNARAEMRSLFSTAEFDGDPRRRRLASAQIRRNLAGCDALFLGRRYLGI
ncbi:hypothetical protein [Sagittula salina]|uniref:Uncharacterized protein n=1 Tax=Sagittula salina TaxID=2820268 RepID=A0A940S2M2_9RHOB|nr:hypothetical protein [Sagittula salina]MBP0484236.1 hypothetical protein [Sagittula salina]